MTDDPQPPNYDHQKWTHGLNREDAHRAHDKNLDFHTYVNQAAIDSANLSLRTLVLINGGAAVAVLAFLGGVSAKTNIDIGKIGVVAGTLKWFAFGVAFAVAGMALAYLTNFAMAGIASSAKLDYVHPYVSDGPNAPFWRRLNRYFHVLAVFVAFGALTMFLVGMFAASDAITHLLATK